MCRKFGCFLEVEALRVTLLVTLFFFFSFSKMVSFHDHFLLAVQKNGS